MSFKTKSSLGGVREAAKMLSGLSMNGRQKVLDIIAKRDPSMAILLKENMILFEDLRYITVKMLSELLQEIRLSDLGLALKIASEQLKEHILGNVSKSIRQDLEDILMGGPRVISEVEMAHDRIMAVVRRKVENGELVLNITSSEEYV